MPSKIILLKIFCIIILSGCVIDRLDKHATIINESNRNIYIVLTLNNTTVDDERLYYGDGTPIPIDSTVDLFGGFVADTTTLNFFVYSRDTVYKYVKEKKIEGIERQSFLQKIRKTSGELKMNDTIILK